MRTIMEKKTKTKKRVKSIITISITAAVSGAIGYAIAKPEIAKRSLIRAWDWTKTFFEKKRPDKFVRTVYNNKNKKQ